MATRKKSQASDRTIDIFSGETREEERKRVEEETIEESKQAYAGMDSRTFVGRWLKDQAGSKYRTRWVLSEGPFGLMIQYDRYSGKPEVDSGPDRKQVSSMGLYVSKEAAKELMDSLLNLFREKGDNS